MKSAMILLACTLAIPTLAADPSSQLNTMLQSKIDSRLLSHEEDLEEVDASSQLGKAAAAAHRSEIAFLQHIKGSDDTKLKALFLIHLLQDDRLSWIYEDGDPKELKAEVARIDKKISALNIHLQK